MRDISLSILYMFEIKNKIKNEENFFQ